MPSTTMTTLTTDSNMTSTTMTTLTTMFTIISNTTSTPEPAKPYPEYVGYIAAVVSVIMYGSNFVPIKKFYTGDGMFFQWVLCCGIFIVGVIIQLIQRSTFYPLAMLGGVIWSTGNLCVVPIFKTIGMGLGMSTWATFGLITGWASGRFGLFGTTADKISNPGMNYAGVALAFGSILLYVMVKNEVSGSTEVEIVVSVDEVEPLLPGRSSSINESARMSDTGDRNNILVFNKASNSTKDRPNNQNLAEADDRMYIEDLSPLKKRIIGTSLGIFSGILYGVQFTPSVYIQDNYHDSSKNGLDYVFAHFSGIYSTSTVYFLIYCAIKRNKPKVYPETIIPGVISGVMWAVATSCWFIVNAEISEAVSFPIVGTAPAAIGSLFWGVIIFREIKGLRNIIILLLAFCAMIGGAVLAGLSK